MEAVCSPETSVDFYRTTRRYIPEDCTLHNHRCENLKSYMVEVYLYIGKMCSLHLQHGRVSQADKYTSIGTLLADYTASHPVR
jgi:hypothetical protein